MLGSYLEKGIDSGYPPSGAEQKKKKSELLKVALSIDFCNDKHTCIAIMSLNNVLTFVAYTTHKFL